MIGQKLNKRYKVTAQIGKGAMGTVYRATDTLTRQEVALKVISNELAIDPVMLERFKREGESLRQLKHPNIVGFIDAFYHQEYYVIVMEYIAGGNLFQLIKKSPLSIEWTQQIGLDLCDALIRAHRLNVIHRDIKPENILIDEDGTPKLADFGVARINAGTRMTRTGTQVGTPYYMAPEAWEGKLLDAQADIWSLGVVFFEMLTGQVPFDGDTGPVVMTKVLTKEPPNMNDLRADVPIEFVKIITRMLTRDKDLRYQTMREVSVDLERLKLPKAEFEFSNKQTRIINEQDDIKNIERESNQRAEKENEKIEKVISKKKKKSIDLKPKANSRMTYWLGGLAVLILGIVFISSLNNPFQFVKPTPENTLPQIISTSTDFETVEQSATATLNPISTVTSTLTFTSTPLPSAIIDSQGVPMALVLVGEFVMGSEDGDSDEQSVHTVFLDTFYMDKYEVTNAFYKKCVDIGVCSKSIYWDYYIGKSFVEHPVVYVTWAQADVYCKWRGGSLPTEAQWEKAARGLDGRKYPWGEELDCEKANYRSCNNSMTVEVGNYESGKSPYGIYDMAGNVWEWTADWYDDNYYQYSPLSNPLGPISGVYRVMRGGAWSYRADDLRSYNRRSGDVDGARNVIGFRCVTDVNP